MVKFAEATARLFKNKMICRVCKSANRADMMRVMAGNATCRKCGSTTLRPYRKK
ncbi:MAG TPA: 50S ribosomal protein L40e [Acidobacteriota bacterium]|nr:50S ribosomal protein L40e [Acidobacteriota bacterium]